MASNLGLKATISAEDKSKSAFDSFSASLKSVGSLGGQAVDKMSGIGNTILKLGGVVGGAGVAIAGFALKGAADMQMMRTSFDVLTGSAAKGAEVFDKLNKMGATTPFETGDLAKATQTMLGFGISSDKALGHLKMLGDVSMGNAEKLQGLSLAFSQVQSTGRLMGQDLLQMINQGFNPLTVISQKTGKGMAELKKEMEAGKISADMVTEAFKTATSEGGLFFNGMDKGAKTFNGVMSTLKDNVGMATRAMVGLSSTGEVIQGGLFDRASKAAQQFIVWLDKNKESIIQIGTAIINGAIKAIDMLVSSIMVVVKWLKEHETFAKGLAIGLGIFVAAALAAAAIMFVVSNAFVIAVAAISVAIGLAVAFIIAKWDSIKAPFVAVGNFIADVWNKIKEKFAEGKEWISNHMGLIGDILLGLFFPLGLLVKKIYEHWDEIKGAFKAGVEYVSEWFSKLPERIAFWLGRMIGMFVIFVTVDVPNFINGVIDWFSKLPDRVGEWMQKTWERITGWFTRTKDDSSKKMGETVDSVVSTVSSLPERIVSALSNFWNRVKETFNNVKDNAKQWAIDTVNGMVSEITSLPDKISGALKSGASKIGGFFSNLGKSFTSGISSAFEGRAVGGPVVGGRPYIIGEKGPELFVPSTSGNVVPNNKLVTGGNTFIINMHGDINNTESLTLEDIGRRMGRGIVLASGGQAT